MNSVGRDARAGEALKGAPKLAADESVMAAYPQVTLFVTSPNAEAPTKAGVGVLSVTTK